MSSTQIAILGAIAGATIFLGLPVGRIRSLTLRTRGFLSVVSAGILLFIFWDVLSASHDIVEASLLAAVHDGSWAPFAVRAAMIVGGLALGALGLAWLEARLIRRRPAPISGGSAALAPNEAPATIEAGERRAALTLGMTIALAIGLHNFSEGLAIGVSARAGEIGLAGTLVLGFALHNTTEGFAIVGPLGDVRPSWGWLFVAGLVAGGPTFVGSLIGYRVTSEPLELAFFALAAGAILYVVGQIWVSAGRRFSTLFVLGGLIAGIVLGLATDLVITAGGG